jgi:hypothetical protein
MLKPNNQLARHSRAGGNPARKISGEAAKTVMLTRYAGMTHFCSIELFGLKPNNQSVSCTCSDDCRVNLAHPLSWSVVL